MSYDFNDAGRQTELQQHDDEHVLTDDEREEQEYRITEWQTEQREKVEDDARQKLATDAHNDIHDSVLVLLNKYKALGDDAYEDTHGWTHPGLADIAMRRFMDAMREHMGNDAFNKWWLARTTW